MSDLIRAAMFFFKCTFERICTDTEVIPQFWLFLVILDQFLCYFLRFYQKKIDLAFPKWIKWHFSFHFSKFKKKLKVSHSSFNVTYMVIFRPKNVFSTKMTPWGPIVGPKRAMWAEGGQNPTKRWGGGAFLRIFKY